MSERLGNIFDTGKHVIDYWRHTWIKNAADNHWRLFAALKRGRALDLPAIPKKLNAPGYVLASGASLDDTPWDALRVAQIAGAGVFAATSNMTAAFAHGIAPDYVMVVDANQDVAGHIKPYSAELRKTILLAPPIADSQLFTRWPGPIGLFRPIQMGEPFIMDTLPIMYSWRTNIASQHRYFRSAIEIGFLNAGCYTNGAVLAAAYLGYDPIFILGNDLGFGHGRSRCTIYRKDGDKWEPIPPHPPLCHDALRRARNGVMTTEEFLHYKLNLFIVWRLCAAHLYQCTQAGIMRTDEMPFVSAEDSVSNWEVLRDGYPFDTESEPFHDHVRACTEGMGMTIKVAPGGLQFEQIGGSSTPPIMTQAPGLSVPTTFPK